MTLLCKPIIGGHHAGVSQPYSSLEAQLHDALQAQNGPSPELPLMQDFLREHPGRALEIGCGSGRLLRPLREAGFEVKGLELSTDMIACADPELATHIHQGDMNNWSPETPYNCLLAPAFTLQLAKDPITTLHHWRNWLVPGGGIYLSTFVPYAELLGELPEGKWYLDHQISLPNGEHAILETRHQVHEDEQKITRHHRYQITGRAPRSHESTQIIRWGEPEQWLQWLATSGFESTFQFLDWDQTHIDNQPGPEDYDGICTTLGLAIEP